MGFQKVKSMRDKLPFNVPAGRFMNKLELMFS